MYNTKAYSARSATSTLASTTIARREVGKHAMAVSPLGVLEGRLADVAGGNHSALPFGGVALQILVDQVIGVLLAGASAQSAEAVTVAGVGKREHPFCFKYPIKYILHLPHRKGCSAHVVRLRIGRDEVQVAGIGRIRSAVPRNVDHHRILLLRLGEKAE